MISLRLLLAGLVLAIAPAVTFAQLEHSVWYFGDHAGLDFRSGAPVARTDGFEFSEEGVATYSDPGTGELLFHTDGDSVWNRNHRAMPGSGGLGGHSSSTQGALVLPAPGDTGRYYIISTSAGAYWGGESGAYWSLVDMRRDNGLGEVMRKKVLLQSPVAEKIAAVKHCNGRGYWILFHELETDTFAIYYLSKSGFEGPRRIGIGQAHGRSTHGAIGAMQFSLDGTRLAVAEWANNSVELFDFDRRTGTLSNPVAVSVGEFVYGVCFSPDATKLYVTGEQRRYVKQFDLNAGSGPAIAATVYELFRSTEPGIGYENTGQMQIGPDGRVYVSVTGRPSLSYIERPNLAGAACGYRHRALSLGQGFATLGMPSFVHRLSDRTLETCRPPRALFETTERTICAGESVTFTDRSYDDPVTWRWSFPGGEPSSATTPDPGTIRYATAGLYTALLVVENANGPDSFAVEVRVNPRPVIEAGEERRICFGGEVALHVERRDVATIAWSPSAGLSCIDCADPVASPRATTTYTVTATSPEGCTSTDQVTVIVEPYPVADAGPDVAICIGESTTLHGRGGTEIQWIPSTGLSCATCPDPVASPAVTTTYALVTSNNGRCVAVDSVTVAVSARPIGDAGDDVTICRGEVAQLEATGGARYSWSPAEGLSCTDCASPYASPASTTMYYATIASAAGCAIVDSVRVDVDPAPTLVNAGLGPDLAVFPGTELEIPVLLDEPLDDAAVSLIDLAIEYDPTIMYLDRATLDSTITEGWTVVVTAEDRARGRFAARLFAASGMPLAGSGVLARLRFQSFLDDDLTSTARLTLELPSEECTRVLTRPVVVRLDSLCGMNHRLIAATGATYALRQNSPNPIATTTSIEFSLGLDGATRVEIIDVSGRTVEVLADATMSAGNHTLTWDASKHPAGVYYCRVTSGAWTRSLQMQSRR